MIFWIYDRHIFMGQCKHICFLGTHLTFLVHFVAIIYPCGLSCQAHPYIGPGNIYVLLVQMWECAPFGSQVPSQASWQMVGLGIEVTQVPQWLSDKGHTIKVNLAGGSKRITPWLVTSISNDSHQPAMFQLTMLVLGSNMTSQIMGNNTCLGWHFLAGYLLVCGTGLGNQVLSQIIILPAKP